MNYHYYYFIFLFKILWLVFVIKYINCENNNERWLNDELSLFLLEIIFISLVWTKERNLIFYDLKWDDHFYYLIYIYLFDLKIGLWKRRRKSKIIIHQVISSLSHSLSLFVGEINKRRRDDQKNQLLKMRWRYIISKINLIIYWSG